MRERVLACCEIADDVHGEEPLKVSEIDLVDSHVAGEARRVVDKTIESSVLRDDMLDRVPYLVGLGHIAVNELA